METKRRPDVRALLVALAVVFAAAAFWAASALASGGSANDQGARDSPAGIVQNEGEGPDRDCPESEGDSGSSSEV
jgi:hypothetical protein